MSQSHVAAIGGGVIGVCTAYFLARNHQRVTLIEQNQLSPDGLPLLGPVPGAKSIWIASRHGMLGLTQGPITGHLAADAITKGHCEMDITALRPSRFQ